MPEQPAPMPEASTPRHWLNMPFTRKPRSSPVQTTLKNPIHCRGVGLHGGRAVTLRLLPAPADTGLCFQRLDLAGSAPFRLTPDCIIPSPLATVAASPTQPELHIGTIEHLMAALSACGIDNLLIQLDGPELPILDGCAASFLFLLDAAGRASLTVPRRGIMVRQPVQVEGQNGAWARLSPGEAGQLDLAISIDFPAPAIGQQSCRMRLNRRNFEEGVAFCRTFVNYEDIAALHAQGLALGGSLENALVIQHDRVLNPGGPRRQDECARHKMLDTIGDLHCAGFPLSGRFESYRSGHFLNNQLLRRLFSSPENWEFSDGSPAILPGGSENIGSGHKNPLPPENSHAIRKSWSAAS